MNGPTSPGMSLETFIAGNFSAIDENIQEMQVETNESNDDVERETTERTTTEDILGKENIFVFLKRSFIIYFI